MQIELTGTNVEITDALREQVEPAPGEGRPPGLRARRSARSSSAEERNPSIQASQKAEANLVLKGATLNAKASAPEMSAALGEVADDLTARSRSCATSASASSREGAPSIRHLEPVAEAPDELEASSTAARSAGPAGRARPVAILRPMGLLDRALNIGEGKQFREYEKRVAAINALRARAGAARRRRAARPEATRCASAPASRASTLDDLLPECFALVREAGRRTLGMRHFDVQLIGGMVLHDGASPR